MVDNVEYFIVGGVVAIGLAVQFFVSRRRHRKDHREELEPILAAHGLTFISANWPGLFKVGPFPKFETVSGRPQSHIGGFRGEYDEYRIVTCRDAQGNTHTLWARVEFEFFQLRQIQWRADSDQNLPPQAEGLLQ